MSMHPRKWLSFLAFPALSWAMAVSVHDVAAYIVGKLGRISTWKLQKLAYYSQAWSLVWDEEPLFRGRIEAWANGPVSPELYRVHRGDFSVDEWPAGQPKNLNATQRETVDAVLKFYGDKPGHWLSDLTHREKPWLQARGSLAPNEPSTNVISHASMAEYYGSLG